MVNELQPIKKNSFKLTAMVNLLLFVAVFILMNHVQNLLEADVKINLTEIVTQNKDVITSKLSLEINNLDLMSEQLSERMALTGDTDPEEIETTFLKYAKEKGDARIFFANEKGQAVMADGRQVEVSGRNYFRRAMAGNSNISERTVSRLDGTEIFVISVPLQVQGKTVGTVQKQYTPAEMYEICSVSLFSQQGSLYIINAEGYILVNSQPEEYSKESDNFYRMIYLSSPQAAKKLEEDIRKNQAGFMETEINGERFFSAYTPIDEIYDWYLISSVATNAVSPNANAVIQLFYFILLAVVLFFAIAMLYFLSQKNRQQEHLKQIAFVDEVTKGDTYAKFAFDLENLLPKNPDKQFYIFTFDLDNFKYINSYYGFDTGDRILRGINDLFAKKLTANERIARAYSDHFLMLLEDATPERIETFFDSELILENITIYLSAGLYTITDRGEGVSLMMDKANSAAQEIKGMRYKRVGIYSEEFGQKMIHNEQMKRAVERALAEDEIIPFFQPKVDIETNQLVGAEALARWRTKDGKLVQPNDFIPVCEKTGLIVPLDMTIFEKTLRFLRHNLDQGVPCVPISINFSRIHLLNKDFLDTVLSKLEEYQVPHELVELELTETALFDNYQLLKEFIDYLHKNDLKISIDDFGSGYSSLHMLKDVDVDILKIDRCFLQDTENSDRQQAVFAAIARMAEQLHVKVVVEGVETLQNVELMKKYGCVVAQGYYFAKPMDEEKFQERFIAGKI